MIHLYIPILALAETADTSAVVCSNGGNTSMDTVITVIGVIASFCLLINMAFLVWLFVSRKSWLIDTTEIVKNLLDAADKENRSTDRDNEKKTETEKKHDDKSIPTDDGDTNAAPLKDEKDEDNIHSDISQLILHVGDRYMCCPAVDTKDQLLSDYTWKISNSFIGEIEQGNAILTGRKAGTAFISRDDTILYHIKVEPKEPGWSGYRLLDLLLRNANIHTATTSFNFENAMSSNADNRTIECIPTGKAEKIKLKWDKKEYLTHGLITLNDTMETRRTILGNMQELMECLNPETPDETNIESSWVHIGNDINDHEGAVDFIGFIKKSHNGMLIVGMGECWRDLATKEEITTNSDMLLQSFHSLLDKEDLPASIEVRTKEKEPATKDENSIDNTRQAQIPKRDNQLLEKMKNIKPEELATMYEKFQFIKEALTQIINEQPDSEQQPPTETEPTKEDTPDTTPKPNDNNDDTPESEPYNDGEMEPDVEGPPDFYGDEGEEDNDGEEDGNEEQ